MNTEPSLQIHGPRRKTTEWTVSQFAEREQVTPLTVRRWIEKGAVEVRRTPGGGIRIVEKISG
jgi:hypothetical protein